jgi:hypothetical protein
MPAGGPPKKVRKLVMDVGIPGSLRGKVWAWFMASSMSARVPGLFNQLLDHDKGTYDNRIDADVASLVLPHLLHACLISVQGVVRSQHLFGTELTRKI